MAAADEEAQNYREGVKMWQRYTRMDLSPAEIDAGFAMLRGAQQLFAERYEIAENPGGGAVNAATTNQDLAWGLDMAKQLAGSGIPLLDDADVNAYVQNLCQRLVAESKHFPTNYELFVLDSAVVNAQTTPGFIFVYRGILEAADTEAELAGVLAHEIGHSVGHHIGKMQTRLAQDQQTLESLEGSDSRLAKFLAAMLAAGNPLGALSFSREQEEQADRLAVHIAYDAGFDPRGLASMFQKFESAEPSSRKSWDLMTRTHPFSIDRVNAVNEYAALLPDRATVTSSPAFDRMKARLAALPPPDDKGVRVQGEVKTGLGARYSVLGTRWQAPTRLGGVHSSARPWQGRSHVTWADRNDTVQESTGAARPPRATGGDKPAAGARPVWGQDAG